ncbi:uncharacterized protein [Zea mays]|uniref:At2g35280-like TPR domain-containing protein n=1 Tax=Zea mays TaxID=4577 RepID=A0A1D6GZJ2_MAIZE|nr:uncharacterized protein LOC111589272 [Zea mays]AQK68158.1 hypothetical protein ZEAMMB73_Zm00001d015142 [Zea mays]|eukprot:XP_023155833.1 uncharacterized protein LOC111589272 [Zea mays]
MLLHVQQPQEAKDRSGHGHRGAPFRHPRGGDCKHRDEVADSPQRRRQLQAVVQGVPRLHWWDKARFLSVLRRCAASGNPEASYIFGLELFCNRPGREASGLRRATERGHAAAAYMVEMLTLHHAHSPPGGTERALQRLDYCSSAGAGHGAGPPPSAERPCRSCAG